MLVPFDSLVWGSLQLNASKNSYCVSRKPHIKGKYWMINTITLDAKYFLVVIIQLGIVIIQLGIVIKD